MSLERTMRRRTERESGWSRDHEWQRSIDAMVPKGLEPPVCWRKGLLGALISRDRLGHGDYRWHISVQHRDRVPKWEEIAATGHELRPGVVFVLGVPPKSWWINVHPNVLHLWELRDEALIEQWKFERRGDRPS